jgi:hypothetical protein
MISDTLFKTQSTGSSGGESPRNLRDPSKPVLAISHPDLFNEFKA